MAVQFHERFRILRERKGWTQHQTARASNVSVDTIRHVEQGRIDPRLSTIIGLCRAFEVTLEQFFGEWGQTGE